MKFSNYIFRWINRMWKLFWHSEKEHIECFFLKNITLSEIPLFFFSRKTLFQLWNRTKPDVWLKINANKHVKVQSVIDLNFHLDVFVRKDVIFFSTNAVSRSLSIIFLSGFPLLKLKIHVMFSQQTIGKCTAIKSNINLMRKRD